MPDARVIIDGGIVADPRWNTTQNGNRVGNLTVRAGRSRKNDQGGYDQLSSTAYDCAHWNEVHDLLAAQTPEKGAQVTVTGTIAGTETYTGNDGTARETVKVNVDGVKVWPKRQQQGGGYGQPQGYTAPPQSDPWQGQQGAPQGGGFDQDPPF